VEQGSEVEFSQLPTSSNIGGTLVVYIDGVRTVVKESKESCYLPLAPIVAPRFKYDVFTQLFNELQPATELVQLTEWLTTDKLASILQSKLADNELWATTAGGKVSRNEAIKNGLSKLIEQGTMEVCRDATMWSPLFLVPKSDGVSSRLIQDCRLVNALIKDSVEIPKMPLPFLQEVVDAVLQHSHVASIDATSMFYQFSMHEDLARFFGAKVGGKRGQFFKLLMKVLPMGCVFAPSFAQYVSNFLCALAQQRAAARGVTGSIIAWVDNFILLTNDASDLAVLKDVFSALCHDLCLEMKAYVDGPLIQLLGVSFDLSTRTASPSKECLAQADQAFTRMRIGDKLDHAHYTRWFGTMMWINLSTMRTPLCFFHSAVEQLRIIARSSDWGGTSAWDPNLLPATEALHHAAKAASLQLGGPTAPTGQLWSDASTVGLSAIFTADQQVIGSWNFMAAVPQTSIFAAELFAGFMGSYLTTDSYQWVTDNEAASRAMRKGHSASEMGDIILARWISMNPPNGIMLVPSACNISDLLSRGVYQIGRRCTHNHPEATCRWRAPINQGGH
jgi:hypothetical protein